jgi:hypothetical protein
MLCDSTKTLMRTILHSLDAPDQTGWDDPVEFGNECLYEMHQMTRPSYQAYKTSGSERWPSHLRDFAAFNRAMPHVKAMMTAIHHKDRTTAIESGNAALAENESPPCGMSARRPHWKASVCDHEAGPNFQVD